VAADQFELGHAALQVLGDHVDDLSIHTLPGQFSEGTSSASLTGSRRDSKIRAPRLRTVPLPGSIE
jgi:hypothetical protein